VAPDNNRSGSGISRCSDSDNDIGKIEPVKVATREIQIKGTDKKIYIPDCIKDKDEVQKYIDENFNGKKFRTVKMKTREGNEVHITVPNDLESQIFFKEKYRSYYEHLKQISQSPRGKKDDNK
jgi:hypothetical protein